MTALPADPAGSVHATLALAAGAALGPSPTEGLRRCRRSQARRRNGAWSAPLTAALGRTEASAEVISKLLASLPTAWAEGPPGGVKRFRHLSRGDKCLAPSAHGAAEISGSHRRPAQDDHIASRVGMAEMFRMSGVTSCLVRLSPLLAAVERSRCQPDGRAAHGGDRVVAGRRRAAGTADRARRPCVPLMPTGGCWIALVIASRFGLRMGRPVRRGCQVKRPVWRRTKAITLASRMKR